MLFDRVQEEWYSERLKWILCEEISMPVEIYKWTTTMNDNREKSLEKNVDGD